MRRLFTAAVLLLLQLAAGAQSLYISGTVTDRQTGAPVEFATVVIDNTGQWAVANDKGVFTIKNLQAGKLTISVSCLGYVTDSREITLSRSISSYKVSLNQDNLSLEGATVTAKEDANSSTTARTIDKTALDHVQLLNVSDISSLLPGGATNSPSLLGNHNFAIRSGFTAGEEGNAFFGTAVEVDGVRLSNNGSFGGADRTSTNLRGSNTSNIGSANVESIEVISGVASVEYGDMSSGVVKINTRKGKTPLTVTLSTTPNNKQASVSKGFSLQNSKGRSLGVINASAEYTRSIQEPMSPFTSYDRNQAGITWSHTLSSGLFENTPLKLSIGVTGNVGGQDTQADPDTYKDSYLRSKDNVIRGNLSLNWLINKPWLTNIEYAGSISYSDRSSEEKKYYSSSTSTSAMHGTEGGYHVSEPYVEGSGQHIVQLPPSSSWSNIMCEDDRPLYFKNTVKANWARNFGKVTDKVKIGGDFSGDKNYGIGQYTEDLSSAPSFREYRYCDVPFMFNAAAYIENTLNAPVGKGRITLVAGIRNDNTIIPGSRYGVTSSWSPRVSAKYLILDGKGRPQRLVRSLSVRSGWGTSTKLPSFAILYPYPAYFDYEVFRSTVSADNTVSSAYFTLPRPVEFNPGLRWQSTDQAELGMDMDVAGVKLGLSAYYSLARNSYRLVTDYEPMTYNYTKSSAVLGSAIPAVDRIYGVDRNTGTITIYDRNGVLPAEQVESTERKQFIYRSYADNDSNPVRRWGLEWTLEFPRIKAINTTFKMDGNFNGYRSLSSDLKADCPYSSVSKDGSMFKYVAYFYGKDQHSNGSYRTAVRNNVTMITHIPRVRLILSMKLEAGLLTYTQALSETADGGRRSWALDDRSKILETNDSPIYNREGYFVTYPLYFTSIDEPGVKKDFVEALRWAKTNDPDMYADLSKLVMVTSYNYIFKEDYLSPYFSANISVTKEIGDLASVSFYANNFFNNRGQVHSSKTGNYQSVSTYIPRFYYGLTVRLKFQ